MTTPTQAIIPSPAKPKRPTIKSLQQENEALRARIAKLEEKVLSLRNERAAIQQWFNWLRGHINAGGFVFSPDYVAETVWKNPPKSWREGGEGGVVRHPETTVKRETSSNEIVIFK